MKIGFVVTAHRSDEYRIDGGHFIERFCNTLNTYCKYDFNLYVVDNASSYSLPVTQNAIILRIDDQTISGITGAWNLGIHRAYQDNCNIIINCNDDLWFNDTINTFIEYIIEHDDMNAIYGPLTNGVLGGSQKSNTPLNGVQIKQFHTTHHEVINGFCFAMTNAHYEKYRYTDDSYFNINNMFNGGDGKWGGQEGQFIENAAKGLYGIVINSCWLGHTKVRGWGQLRGK
jgi:GT2 family glycosyltransferase